MRGAVKPSPSPLGLSLAGLPKIMPAHAPSPLALLPALCAWLSPSFTAVALPL